MSLVKPAIKELAERKAIRELFKRVEKLETLDAIRDDTKKVTRRCEDCKHSTDDKSYISSVHCINGGKSFHRLVDRDFYCKCWTAKEEKNGE